MMRLCDIPGALDAEQDRYDRIGQDHPNHPDCAFADEQAAADRAYEKAGEPAWTRYARHLHDRERDLHRRAA